MELTLQQKHNIGVISDTVLYPEAIELLSQVREKEKEARGEKRQKEECHSLPTSQIKGLLNIAYLGKYDELKKFIRKQGHERKWPESKTNIEIFYKELKKYLDILEQQRLQTDFHLLPDDRPLTKREKQDRNSEKVLIMSLLAQSFIQHIFAENGRLAAYLQQGKENKNVKKSE